MKTAEIIGKERFLAGHNKLSPAHLQATFAVLTRFQQERKPGLKDTDWSFKLRIPFIVWLGTQPKMKVAYARVPRKSVFNIYPKPE